MSIKENLLYVEERIISALKKSNRSRDAVTLIAVSKTKPVSMILEALESKVNIFGENKVLEMRDKSLELSDKKIFWHMIGTLQSNKVKYLPYIKGLKMIHSVDNIKLANEIENRFSKEDSPLKSVDVLIEVNMADEDSKMGVSKKEAISLIEAIKDLKYINIKGLMTIAPFTEAAETNRIYFDGLRRLEEKINSMDILENKMTELSMGMTGDYQVAIEEGATLVRVGTGIFGERNYN